MGSVMTLVYKAKGEKMYSLARLKVMTRACFENVLVVFLFFCLVNFACLGTVEALESQKENVVFLPIKLEWNEMNSAVDHVQLGYLRRPLVSLENGTKVDLGTLELVGLLSQLKFGDSWSTGLYVGKDGTDAKHAFYVPRFSDKDETVDLQKFYEGISNGEWENDVHLTLLDGKKIKTILRGMLINRLMLLQREDLNGFGELLVNERNGNLRTIESCPCVYVETADCSTGTGELNNYKFVLMEAEGYFFNGWKAGKNLGSLFIVTSVVPMDDAISVAQNNWKILRKIFESEDRLRYENVPADIFSSDGKVNFTKELYIELVREAQKSGFTLYQQFKINPKSEEVLHIWGENPTDYRIDVEQDKLFLDFSNYRFYFDNNGAIDNIVSRTP